MSHESWALIKSNKSFNVVIFRRGLASLIISSLLSCLLGCLTFYIYLRQPERDYYATNGELPPVQLKARMTPNFTSRALLPPDPPTELKERVIPQ